MRNDRRTPLRPTVADHAFQREGVEHGVVCQLHFFGASTEQPESAVFIKVARITGAMPDRIADSELRFVIAQAIKVALENMSTGNDDFTSFPAIAVAGEKGFFVHGR